MLHNMLGTFMKRKILAKFPHVTQIKQIKIQQTVIHLYKFFLYDLV